LGALLHFSDNQDTEFVAAEGEMNIKENYDSIFPI